MVRVGGFASGNRSGLLVDAKANAAGLKQRRVDLMRAAVFEQIAQDRVDFDGSALFQVPVHG